MTGRVDIAQPEDQAEIAEVLTDAFADDPLLRWMFPDPVRGAGHRFHLMSIAADQGLAHGHTYVWRHQSGIQGAALWAPPGSAFFVGANPRRLGDLLAGASPDLLVELGATMSEVRSYEPDEAFFRLQFFGVRASAQGQGFGSRLLSVCLSWVDQLGRGAFLESSNPRNLGVYLRQGFTIRGEVSPPSPGPDGEPPVLRPMWRPAGRVSAPGESRLRPGCRP